MVLMNIFAEQQWRHRHSRFVNTVEEERVEWIERVALKHMYYHM